MSVKEGERLFAEGHIEEAIACFRAAAAADPPSKEAYNNLGVIAFQREALEKAITQLRAALELDPGYRMAALNLVDVLERAGRLPEAVPYLEHLIQHDPDPALKGLLENLRPPQRPSSQATGWRLSKECFLSEPRARLEALFKEAQAQLKAGRPELAEESLLRCARVSRYGSDPVIHSLVEIYKARDDIPALMELWKRVAVSMLEQDRLDDFLRLAYISIYAEQMFGRAPNYFYSRIDWDFHAYISILARQLPLRRWVQAERRPAQEGPLRIGFVLEGLSQRQAPCRTYLPLAEQQDPERHALYFYSRWAHTEANAQREGYEETACWLRERGCVVRHPEQALAPFAQVEHLARQIVEDQIQVLVFQTLYFVPQYNLLAHLRCAPIQASVEHQQAEHHPAIDLVFTPPKLWLESSSPVARELTSRNKDRAKGLLSRTALGLSEDVLILVSANRGLRYKQPEFWRELDYLLRRHPQALFLAIGLEQLGELLPLESLIRERVITPGFRDDVPELLALCDLYLDLFPSGGGSSILEAMAEGLPSVAFEQEFAHPYHLPKESVASSFIEDPDLVIPPGDYDRWQAVMDRLILDPSWREQKRAAMKLRIHNYEPRSLKHRFFEQIEALWMRREP